MHQELIHAINNRNVIEFDYDGELRIVEPFCYGETRTGNPGLRAYQTSGYSSSGRMGWKMFNLHHVINMIVKQAFFKGLRPSYRRDDAHLDPIYAQY